MTEKSQDGPKRQNRQAGSGPGKSQEKPKRQNRQAADEQQKPKRQNRQFVVELEETGGGRGLMYTLGAIGGLAIGALVMRGLGLKEAVQAEGYDEAEPAPEPRRQPAQFRPVGVRRAPRDQEALLALEDAVLDAFLEDDRLRECGIDVGAISHGIVELSGSVWTREEAQRAMSVAHAVQGVDTVVNRMEIEDERGRLHPRDDSDDEGFEMSGEWTGHQSGMGSRRQGDQTDPNRRDDSHVMREDSLEQADRSQFADEGLHSQPRVGDPHDGAAPNPTNFREDELDNQSPFGKHAIPQGSPDDGPPQAMNAQSRVGEGLKPGTELALEAADVPVKPHQQPGTERPE
ncbi:BON domain-containing protein [Longimicrobium sp.]|uniref:BON domain-containing protein n=1 Tax=Longimicrobium sp. TaxID=2029185 RepID=UPI003B3B707F